MAELVEFPLAGGGSVLVEVTDRAGAGTSSGAVRGLGAETVVERAQHTFEEAVDRVQPAALAVISRLRSMAQRPDEIHLEFGLNLHGEAGAFIAAASASANFTVAMTWRPDGGTA